MNQEKQNKSGQPPNNSDDNKEEANKSNEDDDEGSSDEENMDLDSQATLLLVHTEVFDVEHQALATERDPQKSERIMKSLLKKARKEVKKKNVTKKKKKGEQKKSTKKNQADLAKDKQSKDLDLAKIKRIVEAARSDEKVTDKIQRNRLAWLTGIRMMLQKQKGQPASKDKPGGGLKSSLAYGSIPPIATPPSKPVSEKGSNRLPAEAMQRAPQQKGSTTIDKKPQERVMTPQSKLQRSRSLPAGGQVRDDKVQALKGASSGTKPKQGKKSTNVNVAGLKNPKSPPKTSKKT
uniref:Uncharacterized protein n=1 Tax=Trichuris muris TaxID=70415 RepID=A0A5S6QEF2_TRIMR